MLIRAFYGDDGIWHGSAGRPTGGERHLVQFLATGDHPAGRSPFSGRWLNLDIGKTTTPPGWTRFHLQLGTFYATDIVCWLLFGADTPDCWPIISRCKSECG